MRKLFYVISFVAVLINCCKTYKEDYSGYIYNNREPVKNAKIIDANNKTNFTFTDIKGYFKLKKTKTSNDQIIIIQKNLEIDTINLLSGGGFKETYTIFLRDDFIDTLYLDREKFFKNQTKYTKSTKH